MTEQPTQNPTGACVVVQPDRRRVLEVLDRLVASADGAGAGANLIALLQQVQAEFGYLPADALEEISRRTRIPLSRIYGVVSFYAQFHTEPRGRHTIRCCTGTACHVKGAERVIDTVGRVLGIGEGETTGDMRYCLETVACLGTCFLAPVIMIDDEYFGELTPQRLEAILTDHQAGGSE